MAPETEDRLAELAKEIGQILYNEIGHSLNSFKEGEYLLRDLLLEKVNPHIAENFFVTKK